MEKIRFFIILVVYESPKNSVERVERDYYIYNIINNIVIKFIQF